MSARNLKLELIDDLKEVREMKKLLLDSEEGMKEGEGKIFTRPKEKLDELRDEIKKLLEGILKEENELEEKIAALEN